MFGLTYKQYYNCKRLVMEFNRLITTPEQRDGPAYLPLCIALYNEESDELFSSKTPLDFLDGYCDVLVTGFQLEDADRNPSIVSNAGWYIEKKAKQFPDCTFDYYEAMLEVCRSNLTKVPLLSEVMEMYGVCRKAACDSAVDWIESNRPYEGITWEIVVDSYKEERVLFKDKNRKLMKPWCFEDPILEVFIKQD